jgi:hypothetical protein
MPVQKWPGDNAKRPRKPEAVRGSTVNQHPVKVSRLSSARLRRRPSFLDKINSLRAHSRFLTEPSARFGMTSLRNLGRVGACFRAPGWGRFCLIHATAGRPSSAVTRKQVPHRRFAAIRNDIRRVWAEEVNSAVILLTRCL